MSLTTRESENLERSANALESIAESLVKLANPPMALAEDDEYRGG